MRFIPRNIKGWFNKPSAQGLTRKQKMMKEMKVYGKLVAVGGALSLGAEGVSALVNHAKSSPDMENSESIDFQDFGPAVIRLDSVDSSPRTKLSFLTMMLICLGICMCLCYPFLKVVHSLVRHCRLTKAFGAKSGLCPPPVNPPSNDTVHDRDPEEFPTMESYWDRMQNNGSFVQESQHDADLRQQVENDIMAREKQDLENVIDKIKKTAVVKAARRRHEEQENGEQDK